MLVYIVITGLYYYYNSLSNLKETPHILRDKRKFVTEIVRKNANPTPFP